MSTFYIHLVIILVAALRRALRLLELLRQSCGSLQLFLPEIGVITNFIGILVSSHSQLISLLLVSGWGLVHLFFKLVRLAYVLCMIW